MELSESELLLYGGIIIMAASTLCGVILAVFFLLRGRRLRQKLEQEYGKPQQVNLK